MSFLKTFSIYLGTVIGVGIFGLPFVAFKSGFFVVVSYFLCMALVAILINFLYGEVILGTKEMHRLPGYVGKYLGEKWKRVTFFVITIGLMGALLAYLIIGGQFLNSFLGPYLGGNPTLYTLLFFGLGAYLVFRGIKSVSGVELSLLFVFFIILAIFFIKAFPSIDISYFKTLNPKFLFFPYGVILFSLWGSAVIPEIKEALAACPTGRSGLRIRLRRVIFWGTIVAAVIYLFFIVIVLGVSGPVTSEEAISGLEKVLGSNIVRLGFIFGVITCFTSFLTLALTLKKVFWYDFGISKNFAWFLTCFPPLFLFFLGIRGFIGVISFTGAIALGVEGIIIVFLYREFLKKKFSQRINPAFYLLAGIFVLGIILELVYFMC